MKEKAPIVCKSLLILGGLNLLMMGGFILLIWSLHASQDVTGFLVGNAGELVASLIIKIFYLIMKHFLWVFILGNSVFSGGLFALALIIFRKRIETRKDYHPRELQIRTA